MFDRPLSDKALSQLITADLSTLPGRQHDRRKVGVWFDYGKRTIEVKQKVGADGARLVHRYLRRAAGCRILLLNALSMLPNGIATAVVTCHYKDRFEYEKARKTALRNALRLAGDRLSKPERTLIWHAYFTRPRVGGKEGEVATQALAVRPIRGFLGTIPLPPSSLPVIDLPGEEKEREIVDPPASPILLSDPLIDALDSSTVH